MALRRLSVHLEPDIDDWLRSLAQASGNSINQELNELLALLKRKKDQQKQREAFEATKAKLAEVLNKKAALQGAAHINQAPPATKQCGQGETR